MPPPNSTELSAVELELKRRGRRRLIGAITLGLLIVVFLPMLFDTEPKRAGVQPQEISIQLPAKDGLAPLPPPSPPQPMTAAPAVAPALVDKSAIPPATADAAGAKIEAVNPAARSTTQSIKATEKPAQAASVSGSRSETRPGDLKHGYIVQIGAFRDAENAQQITARMKEAKLPVYTDSIATKTGKVIRVRVGPFNRKEQADAALAKVKLAGADGKIVSLP